MSFGNSALLWGLLAASIPIIIHLLNRRRFRTVRWAALDFLRAAFRKNQKRLRIENLLLLIIRTALIVLLVLALARPTLEGSAVADATGRKTHLTILLDNSYSMGLNEAGASPFARAVEEVGRIVDDKDDDDPVTLYLTNDNFSGTRPVEAREVFSSFTDKGMIKRQIERIALSHCRSELADGLTLVAEGLDTEKKGHRVFIITDLQAASLTKRRSSAESRNSEERTLRDLFAEIRRKGAGVRVIDVGASSPVNLAVADLRPAEDLPMVERNLDTFRARIANFGPRPETVDVSFSVDGEHKGATSVLVPAADADGPGEASAGFVLPPLMAGPHTIRASIPTDPLPVDDQRWFTANVRESIRVLAVDGDPHADSGLSSETLYLRIMIAPEPERIEVEEIDYLSFLTRNFEDTDVLILANLERVREDKVRDIERFVADGGSLVIFLGNRVDPSLANRDLTKNGKGLMPGLLAAEPVVMERDESTIYLDLDAPSHPLLDRVLGTSTEDRSILEGLSPKIWGWYPVEVPEDDPDVTVLLRLNEEKRSPALIEKRFGRGRVLLFTTPADLDWNDFPNGSLAIPLLHHMVYYLAGQGSENADLRPYDLFVRDLPGKITEAKAVIPGGESVNALLIEDERRTRLEFDRTGKPGVYQVNLTGRRKRSAAGTLGFAVNVDTEEGDVSRLSESEFKERFGVGYARTYGPDDEDGGSSEGGEISGILLLLILLLLLLEVFLARRYGDFARHHRKAEATA